MKRKRELILGLAFIVTMTQVAVGETNLTSPVNLAGPYVGYPEISENSLWAPDPVISQVEYAQPQQVSCDNADSLLPLYDTCGRKGFCYAGYEHVLVKPHFSRNFAYWRVESEAIAIFSSFDWDTTYTPRVYLGYQAANGTGIRGRYWTFDGETSFAEPEPPLDLLYIETNLAEAGDGILVDGVLHGNHSIEARVLDLEFTHRGDLHWGCLLGSGGVRYAKLEQNAYWMETGGSGPAPPETIKLMHDFEGIGPTLGLEAGVPLFDSNFAFFVNGRASLLFGNRSATMFGSEYADIISDHDGMLTIAEAQAGFDWSKSVGDRNFTLRIAMETQSWFRGGGASGGDDEGLPANESDLGFFGASVSTIFEF